MARYLPPLADRFAATARELLARVQSLEARTALVNSTDLVYARYGTLDPGYSSGDPMVTVDGDAGLTGPYEYLRPYRPTPSDRVMLAPVGVSYLVVGSTTPAPSGWVAWTPSFTNFTVGNGSTTGWWRHNGDGRLDVIAEFTFGSSSSIGGALGLTLPGGYSGDGSRSTQAVPATCWDVSLATGRNGYAKLAGGGGTALDRLYGPSNTAWNATSPITWGAGDVCTVQGAVKVTA